MRALALRQRWWERQLGSLVLRLARRGARGQRRTGGERRAAAGAGAGLGELPGSRPTSPGLRCCCTDEHRVVPAGVDRLWAGLHSLRRARHSELARLRAEAERSALERDALRARLNPHFMFNALNNLRALILEDPERARDMVTRLSRTLRQALAHNRSEQVTLAEELAVVDDYLAIEAVHFEQRLQVRQQIDADAGTAAGDGVAVAGGERDQARHRQPPRRRRGADPRHAGQ
jgi:hypothetical protein